MCASALGVDVCLLAQESWFEIMVLRTSVAKEVKGGVSAAMCKLLKLFFEAPHDLRTAGITLQLQDGTPGHLWFGMGPIIADEVALHQIFGCKGAAGLKPCMLCANIFNTKYRKEGIASIDAEGWALCHDSYEHNRFVLHTRDTISDIINRLGAPMGIVARSQMETNLGWNHEPSGIMHDASIVQVAHPVDHACFDWMHVFFVSGVWNILVWLMIQALRPLGITLEAMEQYVCAWKQPKRRQGLKLAEIFSKDRWANNKGGGHVKCTASEGLSLLPIIACFMSAVMEGARAAGEKLHARCYLLCTSVVELLLRSAKESVSELQYLAAASAFLKSFSELYGSEAMPPKFHSVMHFGKFLSRWTTIPNCWCLERKHRLIKRWHSFRVF